MRFSNSLNQCPQGIDDLSSLVPPSQFLELKVELLSPQTMTQRELLRQTGDLMPVYAKGFMVDLETSTERHVQAFEDLKNHLQMATELLVISLEGKPKGFICASVLQTPHGSVYHLQGIILDPELEGQGIARKALNSEFNRTNASILAFHTQSKRMVGLGERLTDSAKHCEEQIAPYVAHHNLDGRVDRKRYGTRCLYGNPELLEAIAIDGLSVNQGDAVFFAAGIKRGGRC